MNFPNRKKIRRCDFDYSGIACYFITINVKEGLELFGEVRAGTMYFNDAGCMVFKWIMKIPNKFKNCNVIQFVIMPNHIHILLDVFMRFENMNLGSVIQWLKTMSTNEYTREVKKGNWVEFSAKLWHRIISTVLLEIKMNLFL